MKHYYAYIRVSTTKQGEKGASLKAQCAAIEAYARQHELCVIAWFEEQETAAKRGRQQFTQMLADLTSGNAHGVIIHKIDRGARNLRDWADIGELIDRGIEVRFAHEGLDLNSRGGRLSADIQAVVAADFVRNLRQEVRKGIYGRLKEGIYPWSAPHGYKNTGGGNAKVIDPVVGPLVKRAFELYATGRFSLEMIAAELERQGLKLSTGRSPSVNSISLMLNNPFYMGIIHVRTTGETFSGVHKPLITPRLFEQVRDILHGRTKNQGLKHDFLYRKTFSCASCSRVLIPEKQKGHVYYRCQAKTCKGTCVREEALTEAVDAALAQMKMATEDIADFTAGYEDFLRNAGDVRKQEIETREMRLANIDARIARLTDAYIDRLIEKAAYEERNNAMLRERARLKEELGDAVSGRDGIDAKLQAALEFMRSLQDKDNLANPAERLELLKSTTSNLGVQQKALVIAWKFPGDVLAEPESLDGSAHRRGTTRTECVHDGLLLQHTRSSIFCKMLAHVERDDDRKQSPHVPSSGETETFQDLI